MLPGALQNTSTTTTDPNTNTTTVPTTQIAPIAKATATPAPVTASTATAAPAATIAASAVTDVASSDQIWLSFENNYGAEWELSGLPALPYSLRLTDAFGRIVELG